MDGHNDSWPEVAVPAGGRSTLDTATLVSIGSSCVILISGAIAVCLLIVYMKKSEAQMQTIRQHSQHALSVCAKCGATLALTRLETPARRSVGVTTEVEAESALYAISGPELPKDDTFLGVIMGHVTEDMDTTYSTATPQARASFFKSERRYCHSACSSAQDSDLARLHASSGQRFQDFSLYESIGSEREDTPTDPGIREFTKSPPEPNERRHAVVSHSLVTCDDRCDDDPTTGGDQFGAISRFRSRRPQWMVESGSETIKCLSALTSDQLSPNSDSDSGERHLVATVRIDC